MSSRSNLRVVAVALIAISLAACQPKKTVDSNVKDFAYDPSAKNFAVIAGHNAKSTNDVIYDASNWENMLARAQLGKFKPIYIEKKNATVADLLRAFEQIGTEMAANSTIMFAFSGAGKEGKLIADREFTYSELAAAMRKGSTGKSDSGTANSKRFYMFVESSIEAKDGDAKAFSDTHLKAVFADFNQVEKTEPIYQTALIFASTTIDQNLSDQNTASYYGRFSYEFVSTLDKYVRLAAADQSVNPTLRQFFSDIANTTNNTPGRNAALAAKPESLVDTTLFSKTYTPPIEPTPQPVVVAPTAAVTVNPAVVAPTENPVLPGTVPATGQASAALNLPLQGASGATTLGAAFQTEVSLIEISASWCGPCMQLAETLATRGANGKCGVVTLIVTDNESSLSMWTSQAQSSGGDTGAKIAAHSYAVGGSQELKASWLSTLTGEPVQISFFPTLFALNRAGNVTAVGQQAAMAQCGM